MAHSQNSHETFREYLLGRLKGEDLEAFEKRLLTEDEEFEELLGSAEDDLVDEYAAGDLSNDDREAFEKHYLITNERYEEVDFARTLDRYRKPPAPPAPIPVPPPSPINRILRVALVVMLVSFISVPVYRYVTRRPNIATITLNPSIVTRSEQPQPTKVNIGDADMLRVLLNLPAQFPAGTQYRAELEGRPPPVKVTNQDARTVTVEIPTEGLRKGQHELKLFAVPPGQADQPIAVNYSFTVE
jgi:hypothetical protein